MSKLDELIRELCPNGVEHIKLGKICSIITKQTGFDYTNHIKSRLLIEPTENAVPYIQTKFFSGRTFNYQTDYYVPMDIVERFPKIALDKKCILFSIVGASIGNVGLFPGNKMCFLGGAICVAKVLSEYNIDYIYYCVESHEVQQQIRRKIKGAGQATITVEDIRDFELPLPPLEIQCEIVRILDNFTNLTAELTAELTGRKTQYNYYRNKLLSFDAQKSIRTAPLADIAEISTGSSNTDDAVEDGIYPFYVRSQEPLRKNEYEFDEEAIITAGDGVGVGKVFHYVNGKYALHQRAYRIHPKDSELLGKYLYHYFVARFPGYIGKQMYQGSVPSIRRPMLNKFEVVIPPLEVQEKIAKILDNFDTICSDLNIGLPAEIEARQKQYEYYRDKLLTFAETGNTILSRAEQSRAEQSRAEQSRALIKLLQYVFGYAMLPLSEIANVFRGEYITKKNEKAGNIPVILGGQEPAYYIDRANHIGEIVAVARSGASAGFVSYWDEPIFITDGFGYEVKKEVAIPKYLYYALKNKETELNGMKRGAGVPHVSGERLGEINLPVPPIEEQKRIVSILDRFDTICNDLTSGLPAEIEARQKQYEYYRDKLLNFGK